MKLKNVSHYAIYDQKFDNWKSEVLDRWTYDDFVRDPQYKKKWISITSLAYHQPSDAVYLGIGSFSAELLWKFDRKAKTITSCGYEKVGEPFDAKFHRSLELDGNTLYGGVALFHDIDKQFTAKGGRLVKYDINTGEFTFLAVPAGVYPVHRAGSQAQDHLWVWRSTGGILSLRHRHGQEPCDRPDRQRRGILRSA